MSRTRIIYSSTNGKKIAEFKDGNCIFCTDEYAAPVDGGTMVMGDIAPYTSQIDGSTISSRSQHRAHLRQHGCIEIGNETKHLKTKPIAPPPGLKERIIAVANEKLRYK